MTRALRIFTLMCLLGVVVAGQAAPARRVFEPLRTWRRAVLAGDAVALDRMYVHDPHATFQSPTGKVSEPRDEIAFWSGFKRQGLIAMRLEPPDNYEIPGGVMEFIITAELQFRGGKSVFVNEAQAWAQDEKGAWVILGSRHDAPARLQQPITKPSIYPAGTDAKQQIATALAAATKEHKRVLVVFGADWCYDCHVLDKALERPDVAPLVKRGYRVVHVDVGEGDKNQDLMAKYGVPMAKGIPGVAVLDASGKLLYSQRNGEFEKARSLGPEDLVAFLEKWKVAR